MLPRTDHIKLSMHFSAGLLVHFNSFPFFRLRTVVVVGSLYWARSRLQPSTFRILFPTYLESVPPQNIDEYRYQDIYILISIYSYIFLYLV